MQSIGLETHRVAFWRKLQGGSYLDAYLEVEEILELRPLAVLALVKHGHTSQICEQSNLILDILCSSYSVRDILSLAETLPEKLWREEEWLNALKCFCRRTCDSSDLSLVCNQRRMLLLVKALVFSGELYKARRMGQRLGSELCRLLRDVDKESVQYYMIRNLACSSGETLVLAGEHQAASRILDQLAEEIIRIDSGDVLVSLGQLAFRLCRYMKAEAIYREALSRGCRDRLLRSRARWGIGMSRLMARDYSHQNFTLFAMQSGIRIISYEKSNRWRGQEGCRVLVHCEQGPGEEIFFSRFMPMISEKFPKTSFILEANPKLASTLKFLLPNTAIMQTEEIQSLKIDYNIMAGMLPFYLDTGEVQRRLCTETNTSKQKGMGISDQIPDTSKKYRVGIIWRTDRTAYSFQKSVGMRLVRELSKIRRIQLFSFQHRIRDAEKAFCQKVGVKMVDPDLMLDWSSLYSTLSEMDELVTCSSALAHLAAAAGVRCRVLLGKYHSNSWMWNEQSGKSDWYPTVTIYRVNRCSRWNDAIREAISDLINEAGAADGDRK